MTTFAEITPGRALRRLREVVAERPEHVYRPPGWDVDTRADCLYVHLDSDGVGPAEPGCLVAHVLHREGVPLSALQEWEGRPPRVFLGADAGAILAAAQQAQDDGKPWSVALVQAEASAVRRGVTDASGNIIVD